MNKSIAVQITRSLSTVFISIIIINLIFFISKNIKESFFIRSQVVEYVGDSIRRVIESPFSRGNYFEVENIIRNTEKPSFIKSIIVKKRDFVIAGEQESEILLNKLERFEVMREDLKIIIFWSKKNIFIDNIFSLLSSILLLLCSIPLFIFFVKKALKRAFSPLMKTVSLSSHSFDRDMMDEAPKEIIPLVRKIIEMNEKEKLASIEMNKYKIAKQVAHDIRSPLTALDMALHNVTGLSEDRRILIRGASQRIHDIANNLLNQNSKATEKPDESGKAISGDDNKTSPQLLSGLIDMIVSEKREQFRAKIGVLIAPEFDDSSYGLFAEINSNELKRVISNLINNSVEAMNEKGVIQIGLKQAGKETELFIKDNGKGMSQEILEKIGERGFSVGKENIESGSGLGVFHAKEVITKWGGRLEVESTIGEGTVMKIVLPLVKAPDWFVSEIFIKEEMNIIVLDDDVTIHRVWKERFEGVLNKNIKLYNFSTPKEFREWVRENHIEKNYYLCDFELIGSSESGLDLIEELNLQKQSVLVTSRFEESEVRSRCLSLKVKCIPKGLASIVPIRKELA